MEKLSFKYLKRNVQARFFGLPVCPELHRTIFPKNVDLGCFLKVTGNISIIFKLKNCFFTNPVNAQSKKSYSFLQTQDNTIAIRHCKKTTS